MRDRSTAYTNGDSKARQMRKVALGDRAAGA
jgi:hypothetical protein